MNDPRAVAWWRNLSINQMDSLRLKYFPNVRMYLILQGYRWIEELWLREGCPTPQKLIPIPARFMATKEK